MTTNIDSAAEVIGRYVHPDFAEDAAQALAAEGYLMPDLPGPKFAEDNTPYWEGNGESYQPGEIPGTVGNLDAYGEFYEHSVEDIRAQALAMLAAAAYAEEEA